MRLTAVALLRKNNQEVPDHEEGAKQQQKLAQRPATARVRRQNNPMNEHTLEQNRAIKLGLRMKYLAIEAEISRIYQ